MKLAALTSKELEATLQAIDALSAAYDCLEAAGALTETDDDLDLVDLSDAIIEEMTAHSYADAGYAINQMVGRGEVDRYVRPDGHVGYAPPGAWDELGANQDADWEL